MGYHALVVQCAVLHAVISIRRTPVAECALDIKTPGLPMGRVAPVALPCQGLVLQWYGLWACARIRVASRRCEQLLFGRCLPLPHIRLNHPILGGPEPGPLE